RAHVRQIQITSDDRRQTALKSAPRSGLEIEAPKIDIFTHTLGRFSAKKTSTLDLLGKPLPPHCHERMSRRAWMHVVESHRPPWRLHLEADELGRALPPPEKTRPGVFWLAERIPTGHHELSADHDVR